MTDRRSAAELQRDVERDHGIPITHDEERSGSHRRKFAPSDRNLGHDLGQSPEGRDQLLDLLPTARVGLQPVLPHSARMVVEVWKSADDRSGRNVGGR